jgi:hypothetical protein
MSRGYENPIFDIIVIEFCSTGHFPLEEAHEHFSQNQGALSGVNYDIISVLLWCCSGYIVVYLPFLEFYLCYAYFLYIEYYKWYQSTFLDRKLWVNFFLG